MIPFGPDPSHPHKGLCDDGMAQNPKPTDCAIVAVRPEFPKRLDGAPRECQGSEVARSSTTRPFRLRHPTRADRACDRGEHRHCGGGLLYAGLGGIVRGQRDGFKPQLIGGGMVVRKMRDEGRVGRC